MPFCPLDRASSTGNTKHAESWPSGRPAFIRVGLLGIHSRVAISLKKVSATPSIASGLAPYVTSGAAIVRATRQNRSSGASIDWPASFLIRYRRERTVRALSLRSRGMDFFVPAAIGGSPLIDKQLSI